MFVFRNFTVEPFFPKDYTFSGYDDISGDISTQDGFVWFYQVPVKLDTKLVAAEIFSYIEKLDFVLERVGAEKTFVALTMDSLHDLSIAVTDREIHNAIVEYNQNLYRKAETRLNFKVFDIHDFYSAYPSSELFDWKFYFISMMGLNPKVANDFKTWWNKHLSRVYQARKKCLILDLDNTLWGGILGEDGVFGVKLGGTYPGNAFSYFQSGLKELANSGVILAICSKNNESDVKEFWEKNPNVILTEHDFSASRINWNDKASNIEELASELNIGLDSMVFLDDNPVERELVRGVLPMVEVPEFPTRPYELMPFFFDLVDKYFKVYALTAEDKNKTEQYRLNAERNKMKRSFDSMEDFLASLDLKLTIKCADESAVIRLAQMTQKTNQFNLTTKRYTDSELMNFMNCGWGIYGLSVSDKFGDYGLTGLFMQNPDHEIDTLLLSCRVLGKGIEFAFMKVVFSILRDKGFSDLSAYYIPTLKNKQVSDFYEKCGFELVCQDESGTKRYKLALDEIDTKIDDIYQINIVDNGRKGF